MKRAIILSAAALAISCAASKSKTPALSHGYPINPVAFTSVKVDDAFWGQKLRASREVTIPLAFSKCEESGRYQNFVKATMPCDTFKVGGYPFDDTDVYKTIEGASYSLQTYPDKKLEAYIDSVLTLVGAAQEADGYLNTSYTMNPSHPHSWMSPTRWEKVENLSHEFYNLGHMVDGAVAHYQATGKRNFLDIAIRYADCVCREIGRGDNQLDRVPGHQIAEMALARLYLVTGDQKYLDQAKYFLDRRGHTSRKDAYSQAHKPVTEQDEAVGHAVRAVYMYAGMADVAALTGDTAYVNAIGRIWENIVGKKLYVTGGIGARHAGESFGDNYELPNASAYCETCAAIGHVYVNHRLFLLHGDGKYYDTLERTLYNGLISGQSIEGDRFFYPNPLESDGGYERQPWFGCACCPSNLSRFIPSLPGYVYAVDGRDVYVNLYMGNRATVDVAGKRVKLSQGGDYVWEGNPSVTIEENRAGRFALKLRIPGWARGEAVASDLYTFTDTNVTAPVVKVNGRPVEYQSIKGYMTIDREWKKGDRVDIAFDMTPRTIAANDKVEADRGRLAVQRGAVVYCAEWPDNDFDFKNAVVRQGQRFDAVRRGDKLGGITELATDVQVLGYDQEGRLTLSYRRLTMIPYYSWANRGGGKMAVWLPSEPQTTMLKK